MTVSAMKCYHGCNHCGERCKIINKRALPYECPSCSEKETWENVAQCRNEVSMIAEFVLEFNKYLNKVQVEGVSDE